MSISPDRWTLKTQEALAAALERARTEHHAEVTPDHILVALLGQADGMAGPILARVGVEPALLGNRLEGELSRLAKSYGGEEPRLNAAVRDTLAVADSLRTDMGDEYLSVEHLLLAMADRLGVTKDDLLSALRDVRGSHRVTSQNPEDTFQALEQYGRDLTELARQGKMDPVIGRDEEIRRVIQVLSRRTKNNPVLIGEPGVGKTAIVEGLAQRIVEGRRAGGPEGQAGHRARPVGHGGRGQVPGRVRGAAEGGAEGDQRRRGRGHHLHRRAAHHRRGGRWCRGGHGRRQHAQADAGPRRAPADRRHHPRRVPQVHREGRRPGAALPAGVRGASRRWRTPSPSCGA